MANELKRIAKDLVELKRRVTQIGSTSQLQHSAIENGAVQAFSGDSRTMVIGRQWDGTYAATSENGPIPPTPTGLTVLDATEALVVRWDGTFAGGALSPMDWARVDIHIGTSAGFTASHDNRKGSIVAALGGEVTVGLTAGTYYVKLVSWTLAGSVSLPSVEVEADAFPVVVTTDGFAPASSPDPTALSGIDAIYVRWQAITNADPVKYEVHISPTLGFTATPGNTTTLVGTTAGTAFTIKALPGPEPDPDTVDPRTLLYDTSYYIRLIAIDDDGAAAQSLQAVGSVFQVTGINLAADSVTALNIVAGTLTGELFSASVVVAGTFKSAEAGQRVEWGVAGIQGYKSDGSLILNIPTDGSDALFDGEFIIRGATILGGISIQSDENEFTANSQVTLMRGIVSPSATPTLATAWDTIRPSTATLTAAEKTGPDLGTFDLDPAAVSHIEWKSGSGGYWVIHQIRAGLGTRAWFFHADGTPFDILGTAHYFNDQKEWETWSTTTIASGPKAGTYSLFRFLSGAGTDWYVNGPVGFNKYTRTNTTGAPALGNNGTDFFIAEVINGDQIRINYHSMQSYTAGSPIPTLPAASTTYQSATGYATSLCAVVYNATGTGGFDVTGTVHNRYATAERGVAYSARLIQQTGTGAGSLFPGGSGGWAASNKDIESWESPTTNRRGMDWDGTNFWTYGGDGLLYKHTGERWDPAATSSVHWGQVTFVDTDAGGTGTHETTAGLFKSFTHKRRAKIRFTPPSIPDNGGTDDPNAVQLYTARSATQPVRTAMWAQGSPVTAPFDVTTLATTGSNPPATNTFPAANAAKIRNDDDTLVIDGLGNIKGVTLMRGVYNAAIEGPVWRGNLTASTGNITASTWTNITTWTAESGAIGITNSSGLLTLPIAGRYLVIALITWTTNATGTLRGIKVQLSGTDLVNKFTNTNPTFQTSCLWMKEITATASQTLRVAAWHNATSSIPLLGNNTAGAESYFTVRYVGP